MPGFQFWSFINPPVLRTPHPLDSTAVEPGAWTDNLIKDISPRVSEKMEIIIMKTSLALAEMGFPFNM